MISYNSSKSIESSIEVKPYFATIVQEQQSYYKVQVVFSILRSSIIKNDFSKVVINVIDPNVYVDKNSNSKSYSPSPSKKTKSGLGIDPASQLLIQSVLQKQLADKKEDSIIATCEVPLYSYVSKLSKSTIDGIKNGKEPQIFTDLYETANVLEVSKNNFSNVKSKNISDVRQSNIELLTKYRTDITEIFYQNVSKHKEIEDLKNYYIGDLLSQMSKDSVYYGATKKLTLNDRVFLKAYIDVPISEALSNKLFVEFYAVKMRENSPIDVQKKSIDFLKLKSSFYSIMARTSINISNNSVVVKQNESLSNGFILKRKTMNSFGSLSDSLLVAKENLQVNKEKSIKFSSNEREIFVFRCNSANFSKNIFDSFVTGKVVGGLSQVDTTSLIVTTPPSSPDRIRLEIKNPPLYADQYAIFRSKMSLQKNFLDAEKVVGFSKVSSKNIVFEDKQKLEDKAIYKYQVFYLVSGTKMSSVSQIFKYINSADLAGISVGINSFSKTISGSSSEVQFNISTTLNKSEVSKLYDQIKSLNLMDQFSQEFSKINDQFTSLVSHKVSRINLTTGLIEDFGEISLENVFANDVTFYDNAQSQKVFSASPIDPFVDYLYEVRTFLKNPITLFSEYIKTVTVQVGKATKTYSYKPYKWMQKISKKTGSLLPEGEDGNILLPQEIINEHNEIGVTATKISERLSNKFTIENLRAERIDQRIAKVSWEITGDISEYDNFAIVKEVDKQKSFIGSTSTTSFIDEVQKSYGTVVYYVIPILKDLSVGIPRRANSIIVDPQESI
jgi:hypothetical protein